MAFLPSDFVPGQTVVSYQEGNGVVRPAMVEAVDSSSPPILSLFVGPGSYHKRQVSYATDGTPGTYSFQTPSTLDAGKMSAVTATPYTLGTEYAALVDATAGNKVVNLPAASAVPGRKYLVKKTDSGVHTVTVTRAGSDTIEGSNTQVLTVQYDYVILVSDGVSKWYLEAAVLT